MKAVAFNGSPRMGGNTEYLLKEVLKPIAQAGIDTELIQVGGQDIHGCRACYACAKNKDARCVHNDDLLNGWLAKMIDAQAIILGSPTYFADVSSDIKALIDRAGFVARANDNLFSRKIGAGVVVSRRGGATHAFDSINHLFLMSRMIVPGSTYWNFGLARDKGDIANDPEALDNMRDLGETIAWLMQVTAGK